MGENVNSLHGNLELSVESEEEEKFVCKREEV
jgi:hypothetical protein